MAASGTLASYTGGDKEKCFASSECHPGKLQVPKGKPKNPKGNHKAYVLFNRSYNPRMATGNKMTLCNYGMFVDYI
ncbi:hypothetical protein [Paraclostridium dentum]|uniref:hypothetical protein n=1 Tax=Paraclostridium dentum TaxID=2662455 RepID=UPI003F2D9446